MAQVPQASALTGYTFQSHKQLKPEYGNTNDILQALLAIARGETGEVYDCHEWALLISPVMKVFEHDGRPTERFNARQLLEKIKELCPDDKKRGIKNALR